MLTIFDRDHGCSRRGFLRVGSLALGGLSLPGLMAAETKQLVKDKSVIFLFLHGGPTQTETFDPKMSAPDGTRSVMGEIKTKLPSVTFGPAFPKLATLADRLAIVRSYVPGDANHDIKPVVGRDSFGSNLGAVYARIAGMNHPATGLPTNVTLFPRSVEPKSEPAQLGFGKWSDTGPFGTAWAPFDPSGGGSLQKDMKLSIPMERLSERRHILSQLDRVEAALHDRRQIDGMDKVREQAFRTIIGGVADAFDLAKESDKTIARYDTAPLVRPENINKKWNNYKFYVDNARTLGKLMLLARRLCERGCGFVTVTTNFVWDMHADVNNAPVEEGLRYMGPPLDHALSVFLEDIEARGLSDKILLVVCGEIGRTPRLNKAGGRDHWGNLGPLLFAGGGLKMGQVIGQSDKNAGEPNSDPVRIKNVIGTILHTVCDMGEVRIAPSMPREISQTMAGYEPIANLF